MTSRYRIIVALCLLIGVPVGGYLGFRSDVVTYTSFRLEPVVITSGQKATIYMSVEWLRTGCQVEILQKVWSIDGTQTYSVDGPYTAKMKDERRILIDKPRDIIMPVLPAGEYMTGFDRVDGRCEWFWGWSFEDWFPIRNTPPTRFRFAVK